MCFFSVFFFSNDLIWFTEEQWEKELENELNEFELVDNGGSNNDDNNQGDDWEKDADNLLGDDDDEEDLK